MYCNPIQGQVLFFGICTLSTIWWGESGALLTNLDSTRAKVGFVLFFRYELLGFRRVTPPETNMDTQNYGLEKVAPALNMATFGINSLNFWD